MSKINMANTTVKQAKTVNAMKKDTLIYTKKVLLHICKTWLTPPNDDISKAVAKLEAVMALLKEVK